MVHQGLFEAARKAAGDRAWGAAVELARNGAVQGISDDGDEVHLRVKARGRPLPHEVYLWPEDQDWGCDCEIPGSACVHVCAALIALQSAGDSLPEPKRQFQVQIAYALTSRDLQLVVERRLRWPDGQSTLLESSISETDVMVAPGDAQVEALLALQPAGPLSADAVRRLLQLLRRDAPVTLDGEPIGVSGDPVLFEVRVTDDGDAFKVGLYRPSGIDRLFRGAALVGGVLRPTSHGTLSSEQRQLLVRGVTYQHDEVASLVGDTIPRLRDRIPVVVETSRLPEVGQLVPQVEVILKESVRGLEVTTRLVYGEPPVAVIEHGVLKSLGGVVPGRDIGAERTVCAEFERKVGFPVGVQQIFPPSRAALFLDERLKRHDGPVRGKIDPDRFDVLEVELEPRITVVDAPGQRYHLDVSFGDGEHAADPVEVLRAWKIGHPLVPLLDGGYAPLPQAWLKEHGGVLRELLEGRDPDGTVQRNATAALLELLEDTDAEVPPDLARLRTFLEGDQDLPEPTLPRGFQGELRHYQVAGLQWLQFLRDMDLHGILADDMGLGKTIQALAVLRDTPGPHLVVAPTSVIRNWEIEARRFTPGLSVSIYHGPERKLTDVDVTLTSYTLLRLDLEALSTKKWSYVVLDEAQSIKNPRSQTARSAFKIPARHRLALTGTPVENRLDELWSLFRFLMPGYLGSAEAFRDRFSLPIEVGDDRARLALRRRIQPYVLRRLKSQVARELPPLTDMVVRCTMGEEQRAIYEIVRAAAWRDVAEILGDEGMAGRSLQILEALLRMRQACCDPALLPGGADDAPSCKLDTLEDLLVELVCDDHKALVFSQWTSLLDRVEPRLKRLGIDWVRLDGTTRDRQAVIDRFQDPSGPPVFLLSLKAGGTGLNLTAADYVVHLDPWWNPAVEQQATDRAHRIGQDKPVVSCRLVAEGTVEERILELQEAKRALADAALGTEGGLMRALDAGELRRLFAPAES